MNPNDDNPKPHRVHGGLATACILAALYLPQSWFFLMDYPWSDYWRYWLKFVPGLPVFMPVAILTHPNDSLTMWSLWLVTALTAATLFLLSRKTPVLFWIGVVAVGLVSVASAFGAHGVFRA